MAQAEFRCIMSNCLEQDRIHEQHTGVAPQILGKVFRAARPDVSSAPCPKCNVPSHLRLCPHCHSTLPAQMDQVASQIMALVGSRDSGKTHYIASMLTHLRDRHATPFGFTFRILGDRTRTRYNDEYYRPLFERHALLNQTQSAGGANSKAGEPLLCRLEFPKKGWTTPATNLVLFDAAGEDIMHEPHLAAYNRYISHAAGLLFLVSPLQIPYVRNAIKHPPDGGEPLHDTLDRVTYQLETSLNVKPGGKIDIPVAFVLTKSDLLRPLVGDDSILLQETPPQGVVDLSNLDALDAEVRGHLSRWGADGLLANARRFKTHRFFAVSALGSEPQGRQVTTLNPTRVADPVLWLLHTLGYLKGEHYRFGGGGFR